LYIGVGRPTKRGFVMGGFQVLLRTVFEILAWRSIEWMKKLRTVWQQVIVVNSELDRTLSEMRV